MFAVRFDDLDRWSSDNIVAVGMSFAYGKRLHCESFVCSSVTIKSFLLDERFQKASRLHVAYRRSESDAERRCVDAMEEHLRQRIKNGHSGPDEDTDHHAASKSWSETHPVLVTNAVHMSLGDGREFRISNLSEYPFARINLAVRSKGEGASILAYGDRKVAENQVCWAKEDLSKDCELLLEFR